MAVTVCVRLCFQVWQIRVDVHMLNHDGNLMDAISIAAITALCHFRRPDVAVQGDDVTVVSEPLPPGLLGDAKLQFNTDSGCNAAALTVNINVSCAASVQSGGERPHPPEYLPHAHQRQLRLLPTRVSSRLKYVSAFNGNNQGGTDMEV